jgi:hypothetical protein
MKHKAKINFANSLTKGQEYTEIRRVGNNIIIQDDADTEIGYTEDFFESNEEFNPFDVNPFQEKKDALRRELQSFYKDLSEQHENSIEKITINFRSKRFSESTNFINKIISNLGDFDFIKKAIADAIEVELYNLNKNDR